MDTHEAPQPPAAGLAAPAAPREQLLEPLTALDFAMHVSMRYHAKRRAWFDGLHRAAVVIAALGSSAAAAAIFGGLTGAAADLIVIVAVAAALDFVFAFADRGRAADSLYRRCNALAAEIAAAEKVDEDALRRWEKQRLLIRSDCEERLLVLHRICFNLEAEARGYAADALYLVKLWQRLAAHIVSLPPYRPAHLAD